MALGADPGSQLVDSKLLLPALMSCLVEQPSAGARGPCSCVRAKPHWRSAKRFAELPFKTPHVVHMASLPSLHENPFDRLLLALAVEEALTLRTADTMIARYVRFIWVV